MVLDIDDKNSSLLILQAMVKDSVSQTWFFDEESTEDNEYVKNGARVSPKLCIDVYGGQNKNGCLVGVHGFNSSANQQWKFGKFFFETF